MESKSVSLFFKEGKSDKEYHAQLEPKDGGWVVNFQYGRRGSALRSDTKTPKPLPYEEADSLYLKVVREKIAKGYRPVLTTTPGPIGTRGENGKASFACELLTSIEFEQLAKYILDPKYWMQDKRDGHRRMVNKAADRKILGINRRGITVPLPEALYGELCDLPLNTFLLDGEIEGNRLVVFDLLEANGDLTAKPYAVRFERLLAVIIASAQSGQLEFIVPVPTWKTREEKEEGLRALLAAKAEGIVFKRIDAPYAAGRAGSHLKFKFTASCSARVRTLNKKRSVGLELLDEDGAWLHIGNVSIPPNHEVPRVGSLVEVRYLYATSGRQLYQPVYLGIREDIGETDCRISQLKFKREDEDAA
jgi:bifunctional non-homologous end joining protein LigD